MINLMPIEKSRLFIKEAKIISLLEIYAIQEDEADASIARTRSRMITSLY